MKRSNQFASLLIAGLSVLTIPMLAQSSGSSTGSSTSKPSTGASSSAELPASSSSGINATSGSTTSRGTAGTVGAPTDVTPRSDMPGVKAPVTGVNNGTDAGLNSAAQFSQVDVDHDGRLSLSEYTQSPLLGRVNASGSGSSSSSVRQSTGTPDTNAATKGRTAAGSGMSSDSHTGRNSAEQFRKLDRNHDGYLTQAELNADITIQRTP